MSGNTLFGYLVNIPSHIHEKFSLVFDRLDITHVQNPYFPYIMVVCLLHLLIEQMGTECTQPQVVMRTSPIRNMIVDTIYTFAGTLLCGRKMLDISVVVIAPHQGNIIGHFQSCVIYIEYLLIRNKHLRHFCHILIHILL